jgi:hypothetical protein
MLLRALIEAMDEVASSAAKPSAADCRAIANRLKQPGILPPPGNLMHPGNHRPGDSAAVERKDIPRAAG